MIFYRCKGTCSWVSELTEKKRKTVLRIGHIGQEHINKYLIIGTAYNIESNNVITYVNNMALI